MRGGVGGMVGALWLFSLLASAQTPQAPSGTVPHSIWQVAPDGTSTHLQSTLVCPANVGAFQQTRLTVFDRYGFDVSCNYRSADRTIAVYLTRLGSISLADAFADANRQLKARAREAVPLPATEQKSFDPGFLHLIYATQNGSRMSGIWMADFSGWMFEFRAIYEPGAQQEVFTEMAELTRRAKATAGVHLALCAKSTVPLRGGSAITGQNEAAAASLIAGSFVSASSSPASGRVTGRTARNEPQTWCVENPVEGFDLPIVVWHAVTGDGQTQPFDRVTAATANPSPAFESRIADVSFLFEELGLGSNSHYGVLKTDGDEIVLYGAYNGRPKPADLARILKDAIEGHAKPLAKVNPKTNAMTMIENAK